MSLRDDLNAVIPPTVDEEVANVARFIGQWKKNYPDLMDTLAVNHARENLSPEALELFFSRYGGRNLK